jgi:hypothetical protein
MLSIECQLAQAQMSRYLAGDVLPPDSLTELRRHIERCKECQTFAEEERIVLERMLATGMVEQTVPAAPPDDALTGEHPATIPGPEAGEPPPKGPQKAKAGKRTSASAEEDLLAEPAAAFEEPDFEDRATAVGRDATPGAPGPATSAGAATPLEDPIAGIEARLPPVERRARPKGRLPFDLSALRRLSLRRLAPQKADAARLLAGAKRHARTLALSGALAIVLVLMSALAADPTRLLGERVIPPADGKSAPAVAGQPSPKSAAPEAPPEGGDAPGQPEPKDLAPDTPLGVASKGAPDETPAIEPERTVAPPAAPEPRRITPPRTARPADRRAGRPAPARPKSYVTVVQPDPPEPRRQGRRPDSGTIQVFDAQGRPIDPTQGH